MRVGDVDVFCSCLLGPRREHPTAADEDGGCVYCGHHVLRRSVTDADVRFKKRYSKELHEAKLAALDLAIKSWRHGERLS